MGKFYRGLGDDLSLYVRQLAWLRTPPKSDKPTAGGAKPRTRWDAIKATGAEPQLPDNPVPQIVERLMEIGPVEVAGMDRAPISFASIAGYASSMGVIIPPWQARLLRRLSAEYLAQSRDAEGRHCPAPWVRPLTQEERDADEAMVRLVLG